MNGPGRKPKLLGVALLASILAVLVWSLLAEPIPVELEKTDLSDMVRVSSGSFTAVGRVYELKSFWIDRFEVSEGDWDRYVAEAGALPLPIPATIERSPDYPARYVSAEDARGFARFQLKRLPSNLEWERASQGPGGSAFPWGEAYLPAANTQEAWRPRFYQGWGVTRVGTFERGRSEVGCYDMIGNVWEWTSSPWDEALRQRVNHVAPELAYRNMRFVRGGSFTRPMRGTDPEVERLEYEETLSWDIGFRCAVSDDEIELQTRLSTYLADLGWTDPVHWVFAVTPAMRKIRALGPRALPYLERTRARLADETVAARLDELMDDIKSKTK